MCIHVWETKDSFLTLNIRLRGKLSEAVFQGFQTSSIMLLRLTFTLCLILGLGQAPAVEKKLYNGPDFAPPFEIKRGERIDGELRAETFLDKRHENQPELAASLVFGNKRVATREQKLKLKETGRDNELTLFINEDPIMKCTFVSSYQNEAGETVPMMGANLSDTVTLAADPDTGTIRVSNRYPLPDGTASEFAYSLKLLGESQVELSWDIGCSAEQIEVFRKAGVNLGSYLIYFDVEGDYRKDGLLIDGIRIEPKPVDELKAHDRERLTIWTGTVQKVSYAPNKPLYGFEIISDSGLQGSLREIYQYGHIGLGFMFRETKPQGSMLIDFGQVAPPSKDAPPAVEGHDLWAQDALHLPLSPTRNLFPNPSFEQGMRYWRWWFGGAAYQRSDVLRYAVDPAGGLFGASAMVINPVQSRSQAPRSFSVPSAKGQTYSVSFYARAENDGATVLFAPIRSKSGGQFTRSTVYQTERYKLSTEWQRFSFSFVSDGTPVSFILSASNKSGKVWLDGIQYEVGAEPTEFVASPLDGLLLTSHNQNNIERGDAIEARFKISGDAATLGKLTLTLEDFFNQKIWSKIYHSGGGEILDLPFDELGLGRGSFVLRAHFEVPGTDAYDDYYRFGIIESKQSDFATKELYGALVTARINRAEERIELMQRMGFTGSTSYGPGAAREPLLYEIREKYNLTDYTHSLSNFPHLSSQEVKAMHPDIELLRRINYRVWKRTQHKGEPVILLEEYSDEILAQVEEMSERAARTAPFVRVWSFGTEEEISIPTIFKNNDFEEYAKLLVAFQRGIKKGNPDAIVLPSGGTSGYGKTRGKKDIEGFLGSTLDDVKWDAVAVHPYGAIDGTLGAGDLDESMQMLRDSMADFGYGEETPIYLNEGGGDSANVWGDGPSYSYDGGQPSYDIGLQEFLHAAKMVRQYIMCLKYWPQLEHFNTWQSDTRTIVDYNLTPNSFLFGISTLTDMLGDPAFFADVRPAQGVRGYVFEDAQMGAVATVWCTIDDVERGFIRGPVMRVKFNGKLPELVDMMGRRSTLKIADDGWVDIQLTPAPLYLVGDNIDSLTNALQRADVVGAGANVNVTFKPSLSGAVRAEIKNLTSREQVGQLKFSTGVLDFDIPSKQRVSAALPGIENPQEGVLYDWTLDYDLQQPKQVAVAQQWDMDYFYVPKVQGSPDWSEIAAIEMTNLFRPVKSQKQTPGGHLGDIAALFQVAWDEEHLYLRVEGKDDIFNVDDQRFWTSPVAREGHLYQLDGCLEVYLDCAANGRINNAGFDLDDYRYDFSAGNAEGQSGPALVCRFREVFLEYAGGTEFPTKEEAAQGIQAEFTRISENRYAYTITFARKYIAPMTLEAGSQVGFGLYLHDRMDDGTHGNKGMSLATKDGAHCDENPQLWPIMVLAE